MTTNTPAAPLQTLPKLGTPIDGGKFAGITTGKDGVPYALILLDNKPKKIALDWNKSMAWAKKLKADLPNRVESAMLFANLKGEFEPRWHWTNEQSSEDYAYLQYFNDGDQYYDDKSYEGRARAVRRLPIDPSILLCGAAS